MRFPMSLDDHRTLPLSPPKGIQSVDVMNRKPLIHCATARHSCSAHVEYDNWKKERQCKRTEFRSSRRWNTQIEAEEMSSRDQSQVSCVCSRCWVVSLTLYHSQSNGFRQKWEELYSTDQQLDAKLLKLENTNKTGGNLVGIMWIVSVANGIL